MTYILLFINEKINQVKLCPLNNIQHIPETFFYIIKNKRDLVIKLDGTPRIVLHKINRNDDTLNKLYCTLFENY